MVSNASNSPRLATCERLASPTCLLPCTAIKAARPKEGLDEYSIKHRARVSPRIASNRACGHHRQWAYVLVGAARIVGAPFDLCRPAGRRRRFSARLLDWVDAQPGASARAARHTVRIRGCSDHGDRFYSRDFLLSRRAVRRAPRSQHPVLEVAASFRPHHRALEVRHSPRHFATPQLRHRRCHAVRHAAAEQRSPTGQRPECRDARGTDVVLPHVTDAPLPHSDRSWPLVRAHLRLVAAGFSLGTTRAVYMGILASVRDLGSREDCVQNFAFPRHAAVPLDRAGAFHHHSAERKPDGNDVSAHSGAIFQHTGSVGRAGSRRDIPRRSGAATAVPRTNLIRMLARFNASQETIMSTAVMMERIAGVFY